MKSPNEEEKNMIHENKYMKHGLYILSYLLLIGIETYFIRSVKILYSPHIFLGSLAALGLLLNFIFLFLFKNKENAVSAFSIYQVIQAALSFLMAYFLFHLTWKESAAYPVAALIALAVFVLIRSELSLRSALMTVLLAAGFTISLRLSGVSGGLIFALALLNSFYLGSCLLKNQDAQKSFWQSAVLFTTSLALGRASIQYYLVQSGYDALGVVLTHSYTFVGLFAGILLPLIYRSMLKEKITGSLIAILLLGIFFPWIFGIFIHVRPFAGYLVGFVVSAFITGVFLQAPFSLNLVSYLNYGAAILGVTVFAMLSNLSRGIRLGMLAAVFTVSLIAYVIRALLLKNKSNPA